MNPRLHRVLISLLWVPLFFGAVSVQNCGPREQTSTSQKSSPSSSSTKKIEKKSVSLSWATESCEENIELAQYKGYRLVLQCAQKPWATTVFSPKGAQLYSELFQPVSNIPFASLHDEKALLLALAVDESEDYRGKLKKEWEAEMGRIHMGELLAFYQDSIDKAGITSIKLEENFDNFYENSLSNSIRFRKWLHSQSFDAVISFGEDIDQSSAEAFYNKPIGEKKMYTSSFVIWGERNFDRAYPEVEAQYITREMNNQARALVESIRKQSPSTCTDENIRESILSGVLSNKAICTVGEEDLEWIHPSGSMVRPLSSQALISINLGPGQLPDYTDKKWVNTLIRTVYDAKFDQQLRQNKKLFITQDGSNEINAGHLLASGNALVTRLMNREEGSKEKIKQLSDDCTDYMIEQIIEENKDRFPEGIKDPLFYKIRQTIEQYNIPLLQRCNNLGLSQWFRSILMAYPGLEKKALPENLPDVIRGPKIPYPYIENPLPPRGPDGSMISQFFMDRLEELRLGLPDDPHLFGPTDAALKVSYTISREKIETGNEEGNENSPQENILHGTIENKGADELGMQTEVVLSWVSDELKNPSRNDFYKSSPFTAPISPESTGDFTIQVPGDSIKAGIGLVVTNSASSDDEMLASDNVTQREAYEPLYEKLQGLKKNAPLGSIHGFWAKGFPPPYNTPHFYHMFKTLPELTIFATKSWLNLSDPDVKSILESAKAIWKEYGSHENEAGPRNTPRIHIYLPLRRGVFYPVSDDHWVS